MPTLKTREAILAESTTNTKIGVGLASYGTGGAAADLAEYPPEIDYIWTEFDNNRVADVRKLIATFGHAKAEADAKQAKYFVTPYGIPALELIDNNVPLKVGTAVSIPRKFVREPWRLLRIPWLKDEKVWKWRKPPPSVIEKCGDKGTLGDLCRELYDGGRSGKRYPKCYYDLDNYGSDFPDNIAYLPQLILDYWKNTKRRYKILEKHGFDPYAAIIDPATLPASDFKKFRVPSLRPIETLPTAKAPGQSVKQTEDDLTKKVIQYAQAVWDATANLWSLQKLAQSVNCSRAGLAARALAVDAIAKVVTGPEAAVPAANEIRDLVAQLLPKLEEAIKSAPIGGSLTDASPPSFFGGPLGVTLSSTPGAQGKRGATGMNALTASLFAGAGPAALSPGRLTRTDDAIAEIENQGRILHELLVVGKSTELTIDGYATYGALIKAWLEKAFFEKDGEPIAQPLPNAVGVLELLTQMMAYGFFARSDLPDFHYQGSEPDFLSVLKRVASEPAASATSIKSDTPFDAVLSFLGKSSEFVVKASSVAGNAVGNLAGPPSFWVAFRAVGATKAFAELGRAIANVEGITKSGGFTAITIEPYKRAYMALQDRIFATMPRAAADEISADLAPSRTPKSPACGHSDRRRADTQIAGMRTPGSPDADRVRGSRIVP